MIEGVGGRRESSSGGNIRNAGAGRDATRTDGGGGSKKGSPNVGECKIDEGSAKQTKKATKNDKQKRKRKNALSAPLTTPVRLNSGISLAGTSTFW
jgi:hypothetical protein